MTLNMEGTKHEKAVLVILSYVVGFTAGFIVFGITQSTNLQSQVVYPAVTMVDETATAGTLEPVEMTGEETIEAPDMTNEVSYKDGRLMANVNGASVLLSAQLATVDPETAKTFATQGVHEALPNYMASEDGNYIYYCEQHDTKDSCINFIYDVTNQIIHYVTIDGVKLTTTAAVAKSATWSSAGLTIEGATSIAPDMPWKLAAAQ